MTANCTEAADYPLRRDHDDDVEPFHISDLHLRLRTMMTFKRFTATICTALNYGQCSVANICLGLHENKNIWSICKLEKTSRATKKHKKRKGMSVVRVNMFEG